MTARGSATRYARALFDTALQEQADLDAVAADLRGFAGLLAGSEPLQRVLTNPAIPIAKKRGVVDELMARSENINPIVARLIALLADRDRMALMPELQAAFERRLMDHRHIVRAEVTTAVALPEDRVEALRGGLARATGRDVRIETRVEPSLVGGAVTRIGSTVYDGSVVTQLQKLKQSLIESAQ
jgi:F-type H+-transporting ATPase subunit delta